MDRFIDISFLRKGEEGRVDEGEGGKTVFTKRNTFMYKEREKTCSIYVTTDRRPTKTYGIITRKYIKERPTILGEEVT